ncbi:hypothetical protein ACP4OV_021683 [Aristida adscensionis]
MGRGDAVEFEPAACRVLPVIEEEEPEGGEGSPETAAARMEERRKAIVHRMRELLRRAAAAQSAHSRLRSSTVATAKKWKRVVRRIKKRGAGGGATCKDQAMAPMRQEEGRASSASSMSSRSSFSWDTAAAESCSSAMSPGNYSPVLWPGFGASSERQLLHSPAGSVLRLSCGSARFSSDDDERMAHWVTTDSDFVVLEL